MSTHEPSKEHPSTYFVQDRSSLSEMERLQIQDQMLTISMGGVLPEQQAVFQDILDVGCATGNWLFELAKLYPNARLVGVDVNSKMIEYARTQAQEQGVSDRMSFHVMDALRMLEFPDNSFDLVNQRLGMSFLRTWDWPKLLQEFQRISRPEGIVRLTEAENMTESTSPALLRLSDLLFQAFFQAGHLFKQGADGVTSELPSLLSRHSFQNVQTRSHVIEYRGDTEAGQLYYENVRRAFRNLVPFLNKWTRVPDDYEETYQQMISEMHQPDAVTIWRVLTAWGTVPPKDVSY